MVIALSVSSIFLRKSPPIRRPASVPPIATALFRSQFLKVPLNSSPSPLHFIHKIGVLPRSVFKHHQVLQNTTSSLTLAWVSMVGAMTK